VIDERWRFPFPLTGAAGSAHDRSSGDGGGKEPLTDEVLLRRAARGDERAFVELLARHDARLCEFVRYALGAHVFLLEDVMQEVRLQLHRSSRTFASASTFRTWLYGLAKNVCHHEMRRRRRDADLESIDEEPLRSIPDERLDPLETLARGEREAAIRRAVESLPAPYRIVLRLRDWEDLSYAQIATALGIPVGTVRSRLHNARILLAKLLEQFDPERQR
jgi:RNA polymerase sigma-70 factor (ECF subfamily)